jgi:hypothetical protein
LTPTPTKTPSIKWILSNGIWTDNHIWFDSESWNY